MLLIILVVTRANANDTVDLKQKPLNIQLQYAGNVGLVSVGAGRYNPGDKLNFCFIYGYLPKIINKTAVHTLALKLSYRIAGTQISPIYNLKYYAGVTALYGISRNTYLNHPDHFPDGYYKTNAIHFSPHLGFQLNVNMKNPGLKRVFFFTELGTLDYKLWSALSTQYVNLFDIWNISLGFGFAFN